DRDAWRALVLSIRLRRDLRPPLFPYTTLFRSPRPLTIWFLAPRDSSTARTMAWSPPTRAWDTLRVAVDVWTAAPRPWSGRLSCLDRKSTRLNSSHVAISYAVFCLKKKRLAKTA